MQRQSVLTFLALALALAGMLSAGNALGNNSENSWVAPPEAKATENPHPATPVDFEKGKVLFSRQCTPCHGESGKGDGPAGQYLGKPLPDFTKAEFQEQSDGALFWKLSKGKAPMPTFEDILSEEQRWVLVGYLRTFLTTAEQGGSK